VIAIALALRLPQLSLRPMHNDEAVNAIKFRALWNDNNYKYDPNEFHGPTLPYFTLPAAILNPSHDFNSFTEKTFRLVPVAFGVGLILLLLLLTPELGRAETLWSAAFIAVSPAMVFYSRYYIHETLLVFFTGLAGMAWWRHRQSKKIGWALLAGIGLGLMSATKETFVFAVLSMFLAGGCVAAFSKLKMARPNFKSIAVALAGAAVVAALFFSSFLTNVAGVADAIKTYAPWFHRAEGVSPHVHPWNFYFERLLWYRASGGPLWTEAFVAALAVVGFGFGLSGRGLGAAGLALVRFIAFYTLWMTVIYTLLPYKTPWCLLGFYHGMILLAGVGAAALLRLGRPGLRCVLTALLIAGTIQLGCQARRQNFGFDRGGVPFCDSPKNPYVYSQTSLDVARLMQTVDALAQASANGYDTTVEVMSPDSYWPLPWYLRRFTHAGFWDKIPDQPLAPIMIVSSALDARFDDRPQRTHLMAGYFELRPNVFYELYVNIDLWTRYLKARPKESE
jgi:uncharacterized protein (TIGR03663 family)